MAATRSFAGAVTVCFFLGVFEAAVTSVFALFTSYWYTHAEQGARMGSWFSFNDRAQIFGGLVTYGIAVGVERHGAVIVAWEIVFLAIGLMTAAVGVLFWYSRPDNQLNTRWLRKRESWLWRG